MMFCTCNHASTTRYSRPNHSTIMPQPLDNHSPTTRYSRLNHSTITLQPLDHHTPSLLCCFVGVISVVVAAAVASAVVVVVIVVVVVVVAAVVVAVVVLLFLLLLFLLVLYVVAIVVVVGVVVVVVVVDSLLLSLSSSSLLLLMSLLLSSSSSSSPTRLHYYSKLSGSYFSPARIWRVSNFPSFHLSWRSTGLSTVLPINAKPADLVQMMKINARRCQACWVYFATKWKLENVRRDNELFEYIIIHWVWFICGSWNIYESTALPCRQELGGSPSRGPLCWCTIYLHLW